MVNRADLERVLTAAASRLTKDVQLHQRLRQAKQFEHHVRIVLAALLKRFNTPVDFDPHPYVFPDIVIGRFGVEVKITNNDSWRSVANSVFESTRSGDVEEVYLLFASMGGKRPEVRWARYEDSVIHVRTSHVPRFEVEIGAKASLFEKFGTTYAHFRKLPIHKKMEYVRKYARARLKEGERLWWLEDKGDSEPEHSLPLQVRLYMGLEQEEKRRLRAEAALLCPAIVAPSRSKKKYDDVALYAITYRGILCSQVRDLYSAGSVALRSNPRRGGLYIRRALQDIEHEMRKAASTLEDALFVEYWGEAVPRNKRISSWLAKADLLAKGTWVPSEVLFK